METMDRDEAFEWLGVVEAIFGCSPPLLADDPEIDLGFNIEPFSFSAEDVEVDDVD